MGNWYTGIPMNDVTNVYCSSILGDKIYAISINNQNSHEILVYDIEKELWDSIGTLRSGTFPRCAFIGSDLYCIYYGNKVEIYHADTGVWTTGTPNPSINSSYWFNFGMASDGERLYCTGGREGFANAFHIYDAQSDSWESKTSPYNIGVDHGCVVVNDKLYCIGGYIRTSSSDGFVKRNNNVYIYDIKTDTWSEGANKPTAVSDFGCAVLNNRIYCSGGLNYTNSSPIVYDCFEVYDIGTNTWQEFEPMPTQRYYVGSEAYNGKVYCFGGTIEGSIATNLMEI